MRVETIGDATLSVRTGRSRALRAYPVIGSCTNCGNPKAERHHKDGNTLNNSRSNIAALCRRCHMEADGRLAAMPAIALNLLPKAIAAAAREKNARTHCKRDHPLSGENLFITSGGSRGCKECRKIHKATYLGKLHGL